MEPKTLNVFYEDCEQLENEYKGHGIDTSVFSSTGQSFDYRKTTLVVNDVLLCSTSSSSGWGFVMNDVNDAYCLTIGIGGHSTWKVNGKELQQIAQRMYIFDTSGLSSVRFSPEIITDTIIIPSSVLHGELSVLQGYPCQQRLSFNSEIPSKCPAWFAISSIVQALRANSGFEFGMSPIAVSHLRQALIYSIIERVPNNYSDALRNGKLEVLPRTMRRALEFISAHADRPIGLADIALASGTSGRNLQLLFKSHRGMSPMGVLREIRLDRCRNDFKIIDDITKIPEIAMKWGFSNRYMFYRYYASRFGEHPKETFLKRRSIISVARTH